MSVILLGFVAFLGASIRGIRLGSLIHKEALAELQALPDEASRAEHDAARDRVVNAARDTQRSIFVLACGMLGLSVVVAMLVLEFGRR